ncbi:MAG: zinc ribbon domain-containing protein [Dermabacter sp.]|nr:zinc ribbon domain-containing protein [Dermabacter sp.]
MPTYVYACKSCQHTFEQYQSFSEDSLTVCPACHEEALKKVFNAVGGVQFKGSGFYSTSGNTQAAPAASSAASAASSTSGSSSSASSSSASGGAKSSTD